MKFISAKSKYALLCSNSESLKLLNTESGQIELYLGHTDIVLTLDVILTQNDEGREQALVLSGAKDNMIKMWYFDACQPFQRKLRLIASFKGHNENISGV